MARVLDNARYLHDGLAELGYQVNEPTPMPDGTSMITPDRAGAGEATTGAR